MARSYGAAGTGGGASGEECDGSRSNRLGRPRRAEPERVINNPHSRRTSAASERPATTFHTIVPTRSARDTCLFTPINHRRRPQCQHYLPLTTTSSRYID
ncbi:hypothetical protein B5X24_HaOG205521 [Helicoverpa armigera]|nr:hypothetical protein B5X24_HaOG205521 [Helicoverpa armigera]